MNKLKLHEAIAVVLLNKENRMTTIEQIAKEINRRGLYKKKDGSILKKEQVTQRLGSFIVICLNILNQIK